MTLDSLLNLKHWEYGVLGISHPCNSPLAPYFSLVQKTIQVDGDIVEFGVWQGASIATTALILEKIFSTKTVFGYDTFQGFPKPSEQDDFKNFFALYKQGLISEQHMNDIALNKRHLLSKNIELTPETISSSLNFSGTNESLVRNKISYLNLDSRVQIFATDVKDLKEVGLPNSISLALIDLDLYSGYRDVLPEVWKRLEPGGYVWLDEYFSLKFPGPRIAINEFCERQQIKPILLCHWLNFERWVLRKY